MYINTTGLVLRETMYKESSKILTVLTSSSGKLTVSARGTRRRGSTTASATQFLAFSDMTIMETRGRYTLTEAHSLEIFEGLRNDIESLSLASYFAEILEAASDEDIPNPEMLSLGLNALFLLAENRRPNALIKAAFELRLACLAGFEPVLDVCSSCGREEPEEALFDLAGGSLVCSGCGAGRGGTYLPAPVLRAMRYIDGADPKRVFSFKLDTAALHILEDVCERYLIAQLGHSFSTLDYYRSIKQ